MISKMSPIISTRDDRNTKPTDDDILVIFDLLYRGLDDYEISKATGFPMSKVMDVRLGRGRYENKLYKLNLYPYKIPKKTTPDGVYRELYQNLANGMSEKEAGKIAGLNERTVREFRSGSGRYGKVLERIGATPISKDKDITDEEVLIVMKFIKDNYPKNVDKEAAELINCSPDTIRYIRTGYPRHNKLRLERLGLSPITYKIAPSEIIDKDIEIMKLVQQGLSDKEIADKLNYHPDVIRKIRVKGIESLNIPGVNRGVNVTKDQYIQVIKLAKRNTPIIQISNEVNLSTPTVRKIIKGEGPHAAKLKEYKLSPVTMTLSNAVIPDDTIVEIFKLYRNGATLTKISDITKVSRPTIKKILYGDGIYKEKLEQLSLRALTV